MNRDIEGDLVTPERRAKGDLDIHVNSKGQIDNASVRDNTLLGYLIRLEILDDHHGYYAMVFLDMRRSFRQKVNFKSNSVYACEFFGADLSHGLFETCYLRVCRRLMMRKEAAILFVCSAEASTVNRNAAYIARNDCISAFDTLVHAIDDARQWAEEEKERMTQSLLPGYRNPLRDS